MSTGSKKFLKLFAKKLKESRGLGQYSANGITISCIVITCDRCGYIHWFNKEIKRLYH